jgi:outer membrane protein, multidrug efflux system
MRRAAASRAVIGPVVGLAALASALGGCDLAPAYNPPSVALPATFKEAGKWQLAEPKDDLPRGPWWTVYKDPTLDRLEPRVDVANETLAAALANYEQARSAVQGAEAGLYPTLDQQSQLTTNRQSDHRTYRIPGSGPDHYGDNRLAIQSSYEVDLWGRVRDTIKGSAANAQSQAALLENVRLSLHALLARNYLALRGLDRLLKLLHDTSKAYQDALTLTQNRLAGKIASPMDVARAQAQLETAKALIDDTMAQRAVLEHAIATLIGEPASTFSIPTAVLTIANPRGPSAAPSSLLERRPDIAAAERAVAATNEGIGVARSAFYPRFFINLYGGTQDRGVRLLDLKNVLYTIGPSVDLPIFDGGQRRAQLDAAMARHDQALAQYRQSVLTAVQEVEDALATEHYLSLEGKRIDAAVTAEKQVLDQSLTLYRDGAISFLDVVVAQTTLLDEQRTAIALLTRQLGAGVTLFVALGGGWAPGTVRIASDGRT